MLRSTVPRSMSAVTATMVSSRTSSERASSAGSPVSRPESGASAPARSDPCSCEERFQNESHFMTRAENLAHCALGGRRTKSRFRANALAAPAYPDLAMKIDKSLHDDHAVLTLKGEFDTFYVPALQQEVEALIERGISHVILDLRLVKFINSTALGAIIKAHKRCKAEAGELMIAQPSTFVRDVVKKVGIDKLIPMYETEAEATKAVVKALNARELAGDAPVDQEKILLTFPDDTRNKMIGGKRTLVGRMANVDGQRVQFLWNGSKQGISAEQARQLFFKDSEVHLKFQVRMLKKSYFQVVAKVSGSEAVADGGVRVTAVFVDIHDSDRAALSQFAEDMEFLKRQLPGR
jgi:anti-anti-sigma factor